MPQVTIRLPYGDREVEATTASERLLGVFSPHDVLPVTNLEQEIRRALANPIGSPPLRELVRGKQKVVLVADDNTRLTPTAAIIPILLDECNAAGVLDEHISIIIALGTHRFMTEDEIFDKFGEETVRRVVIKNHPFRDSDSLVDLGRTQNGTSISINKEVFEADFKLGIGSIVPHHIPGYAGGAKIIQPGVSGEQTTAETHLLSVQEPRSLLGVVDNPVRRELNVIARQIGLNTIFNTVLNRSGEVVKAFFGDVEKAFLYGVEATEAVYAVELPQEADIVLASSHPCDLEFWQAHKTLYAADRAVREGGIIIVATPCYEGIAKTHTDMVDFAGKRPEEVKTLMEQGAIRDHVAAALAMAWGQVRRRARVFFVSDGVSPEEARKLSFTPFNTIQEAIDTATAILGDSASIVALTHAPDMLPVITGQGRR
ncbi:MAG: larA 1 [Anaerosporomusa subterranea]|jgi:nickel-dependent lactate racemase|nr:larA 1 [Anaerosporomusa subterranea]